MSKKIWFTLDKREDETTGQVVDTLVKHTRQDGSDLELEDEWGNVIEFNQLFEACGQRWGKNWDLNKVILAVQEARFD